MEKGLNSIRMRAERDGQHISGAERLVDLSQLDTVAVEMLQRALQHPRGPVERISLQVDCLDGIDIQTGGLPDLHNNLVTDWRQGRECAREMLFDCGVTYAAIDKAMQTLAAGAAPDGKSMRGAMLIDAETGKRLEQDQARGVRVSRMDLSRTARQQLKRALAEHQLDNVHVIEALTLAAKVITSPAIVAELCWSDDPDYLAGYVASAKHGYQRISLLKPVGEERGGRAFFVRYGDEYLTTVVDWLEQKPFLIERIGRIFPAQSWKGQ